jgi:hypothetical protein
MIQTVVIKKYIISAAIKVIGNNLNRVDRDITQSGEVFKTKGVDDEFRY